jgi:type VI secretion system protein ImpM
MELGAVEELPAQLPALATAALRGHSLWWTDGSSEVAPSILLSRGLPAPAAFGGMLAGNWTQSGWAPGA